MKTRILLITVAILAVLGMGACHSSRKTVRGDCGQSIVTGTTRESVDAGVARALIDCARGWLGVPYKYAGNTRKGVDCSGLTCNIFESAAGIKLPRDSRSQKSYCRPVKRSDIQPGDLVFFVNKAGGSRINHVGLYIGDGKMIHASSSKGVMESSITRGYWDSHYHCSGRVEAVTYAARGKNPSKNKQKTTKNKRETAAEPATGQPESAPAQRPSPPARPVHVAEIFIPSAPLPVPDTTTAPADTVLSTWMD